MGIFETIDIMAAFDLLPLVCGLYTIYIAIKMRKESKPASWLVPEEEIIKCKDTKGFIHAIYGKTICFGAVLLLYGILSMVNRFLLKNEMVNVVLIGIFLLNCTLYVIILNKNKSQYFY